MKNNLVVISISICMIAATLMSCKEGKNPAPVPAIDPANLDISVLPGNDFDTYANGGWKKLNPLPADRGRYGSFEKLDEVAENQINDLMKVTASTNNPKGSIQDKIATLFNSGMDTVKIEKDGFQPLTPYLQEIDKISNADEVQQAITRFHQNGISPLFGIYGSADARNSSMVITQLSQGGMGMPDRDYYLKEDQRSADLRAKYGTYMTTLFKLIGYDDAVSAQNAQRIMALETQLAKSSMSRLERRDPNKTYNKVTTDELVKMSPVFNWNRFFSDMGIGNPGTINVNQPEFVKEISNMLTNTVVEDWKLYLKWNLISGAASYLSADFVKANFDFYGKAMTGTEVMRPRWKRVLGETSGSLSEALGQLYVKAYFPQEAKDRMIKLVANLKVALGERIRNLEWMSPETKQKGMDKLGAITVKIGYPDKWRDYSALEIKDDAYVLNVMRADKFNTEYNLNKINKPVDKQEWGMSPQTVNAYYSPTNNEIVFPAAILQPPFFFKDGDDAVNYGAIGVVIGHEMSHGFDDQGRKFDKEGNLTDWWMPEDAKRFDERTKVLVDQYYSFIVLDSIHADGQLCLGENIADLGGLSISHQAFLKANTQTAAIDGFTPEQRFYLAWAHVWSQNIRDKEILRRTKEDPHSLGRFRVLGPLQNLPEFYAAFDVKPGQKMYLEPEKRAKIW